MTKRKITSQHTAHVYSDSSGVEMRGGSTQQNWFIIITNAVGVTSEGDALA